MSAQPENWNTENWQQLGEIARRLVEEKARQRANAPGRDRQRMEDGDE